MTEASIRYAICDDHALFRTGLSMILRHEPGLELAGEASTGEEAVALAERTPLDVMLMDVRMPGIDGIEATRRIRERLGDRAPRILVLTTLDLDEAVERSVRAGASGFILKAAEPELLVAAIRAVHAGGRLFASEAAAGLLEQSAPAPGAAPLPSAYLTLSERERDVFLLAAGGLSNAEIAAQEFVSAGTVKTHISHILQKLELRDRIQLVVYAYEHGIIGAGRAE